ncbi:9523_t:CDS:2, partial [Entrophospora sp. SA101]
ITRYLVKNNLSEAEIANRLGLDKNATARLLRGYTENFSLDSLIAYVDKLHLPLQVKITEERKLAGARPLLIRSLSHFDGRKHFSGTKSANIVSKCVESPNDGGCCAGCFDTRKENPTMLKVDGHCHHHEHYRKHSSNKHERTSPILTVGMKHSNWAKDFIEEHNKKIKEYDALSEEEKDEYDKKN